MKILVVGLGSMGKRRIRLLSTFRNGDEIVGVDASESRREESENLFSITTYDNLDDTVKSFRPEVAFVCTPPLTHEAIIMTLLENNIHVFSEINLVSDGYISSIALAKKNNLVLFLSSTPMYRKEIEYITLAVREQKRLSYRYHVGQYLPDWHPWENYTDFFVSDRRTNGIRELLAIELPWLINAFSALESFTVTKTKLTDLKIDYEDNYLMTVVHKNGIVGQIIIDLVCRKAIRELLVYGEDLYLRWSGTPNSLVNFDIHNKVDVTVTCYDDVIRDSRYSDNIVENAYVAEIEDFFNQILNRTSLPRHSFEADLEIQNLIEEIERSN